MITGGRNLTSSLTTVSTHGKVSQLPELSVATYGHTLYHAEMGILIQNGGIVDTYQGNFRINTKDTEPQWTPVRDGPRLQNVSYHTSVNLAKVRPWNIYDSKVEMISPGGSVETYITKFNVSRGHCVVDNGNHMFAIGVGEDRNEIFPQFKQEMYCIDKRTDIVTISFLMRSSTPASITIDDLHIDLFN